MLKRWNFLKTGFYEGIKLSTVNGGVHVVVQGRTRLDVEASTVNGSRSIGERATEDDRGEAHLQVSTVNGSIKVE